MRASVTDATRRREITVDGFLPGTQDQLIAEIPESWTTAAEIAFKRHIRRRHGRNKRLFAVAVALLWLVLIIHVAWHPY